MNKEVNFSTNANKLNDAEQAALRTIMSRAEKLNLFYWGYLECEMDLVATHHNGCPLNFVELAGADGGNFVHDVSGIQEHLDRKTGQLQHCWRPRYAQVVSHG